MKIRTIKYISAIFFTLFLIYPLSITAQKNNIINPKGKLYYGIELGVNEIKSTDRDVFKKDLQMGLSFEYYLTKQWSAKFRVKMFSIGTSYHQNRGGSNWFPIDYYDYTYKGKIISMPLDLVWNFRIFKNLHGNIFIGPTYNIEISSNYEGLETVGKTESDFDTSYINLNTGIGLDYFYSDKLNFYFINELYSSDGKKGYNLSGGLLSNSHYVEPLNNNISIGIRYSFR